MVLANLLPCDLNYYIKGTSIKGSLKPGKEVMLHGADTSQNMELGEDCHWLLCIFEISSCSSLFMLMVFLLQESCLRTSLCARSCLSLQERRTMLYAWGCMMLTNICFASPSALFYGRKGHWKSLFLHHTGWLTKLVRFPFSVWNHSWLDFGRKKEFLVLNYNFFLGLPLIFRQDNTKADAAGQFEEHELARSLSPLLFCYTDKEQPAM